MATQAYLSNYPAALVTIHGHSILPEQSPSSPIYHTWPLNHTWAITQQPYLLYVATQSYLSNHTVALFTIRGYSILPEQSPSSPIYHTWLLNLTWAITQQPYLPYMATQSYLSNHPAALFTIHGHSIKPEQSPSNSIYHTWLLNPTRTIIQQPYLPYMPTQSYLSNHSPLTHQQYVLRMAMHKAANFRTMYLMKASPCKTNLIVDLIFILNIDVLIFSFTWWTPKAIL